jgi:DNA-binding NarL/FixJ family response regulator
VSGGPSAKPGIEVDARLRRLAPTPASADPITVLLVDDHAIVRQSIATLLDTQPGITVIAEAADGAEAVEAVATHRPQVVVMDVNLPRLNGVQASRIIKQKFPEVRLIGLSIHNDRATRQAMLDAGASAYLSKDGPVETLLETIRQQDHRQPA